jgi:hypothetical protein
MTQSVEELAKDIIVAWLSKAEIRPGADGTEAAKRNSYSLQDSA